MKPGPLTVLRPFFEGLDAHAAARLVAHPTTALAARLDALAVDRPRLVIDVYEALAHEADARREGGVFYTPPRVVEAMLDRVPLDGELLDPACGAGAFVLAIARRLGPGCLTRLSVCDIDEGALDACALALEAEFPNHRRDVARWRRERAHAIDFLRERWPGPAPDLIVGNPPYRVTAAADLPALFPQLSGEIDLYACFLVRALQQVSPGGNVSLLVPDTWLTNSRARRLRALLCDAGLARIVDFGKPFTAARDTRVHAVVLRRNASQCEVESLREDTLLPMAPAPREALEASKARGWFLYRTTAEARACAAMEARGEPLSKRFDVIYGLRTGSNAKHVRAGPGDVPLVSGGDLEAFDRRPSSKHLVDPDAFTRAIAKQTGRAKLGVQRIRSNSRLPWRRWVEAAPLAADEVGLDSMTLLAPFAGGPSLDDETCALLGVLCSSLLNRWYRLSFTDVNVKPAYLADVPVPPPSSKLSALVRLRLQRPGDLWLERAMDRLVAEAWGLDPRDVEALERGYWGDELARRPMPSLTDIDAFRTREALRAGSARSP